MTDGARELLEGAGYRLLVALEARPEWEELDEPARDALREAAFDLGKLTILEAAGHDVSAELAHARAQIASWEFRGHGRARRLLRDALADLGTLLGGFVRGLAGWGL